MRQQDVFKKVGNILQELNEQYDYLKTQGDGIDDLELELFAANANFLSDHLEILRKLNAHVVKSLPAHEPQPETYTENEHNSEGQTEPEHQLYRQVDESVPAVESQPMAETLPAAELPVDETETFVALPTTVADTMSFTGHFHVEQPEDQQSEQPAGNFDFAIVPNQEQAEQTYEPEPYEFNFGTEEPAETAQPFAAVPQQEEQPAETFHIEPTEPTYAEPAPYQEPERTEPRMDLQPDTGSDHFSFIRSSEPDTTRHELSFNEASSFEVSHEHQDAAHEPEPDHEETIAEAMAAIEIAPAPIPEPVPPYFSRPEPAPAPESEKPLTLNERISAQLMGANAAQPTAPQPIKDLKSAITLNDKMLFVRDLFNGYSLAYSEAIEILNRFNNFEDADRFLTSNYVSKNNWAAKPDTTAKFYDLLKRRFS